MRYDPFQQQAIDFIDQGFSTIVSAPTGAGKTAIATYLIEDCLKRGRKIIYTAPIKALSNQKYRDFHDQFPDKVGILTGDVTINANAQTLIMTTEIFRNKILEESSSLKEYEWIIFDEIHFLDDYERGTVWEESLIFLPKHMRLLGLSATIPNIQDFSQWLEAIHQQPIKMIIEDKRPVPLHIFFQCQGKIYDHFSQLIKHGYAGMDFYNYRGRKFHKGQHVKPNKIPELIQHLQEQDMLPCIYFVFSRRRTEILAEQIQTFDFLNDDEKKKVKTLFADLCEKFDLKNEPSAERLRPLIERGIAYHHAGMLPTLKEVVERLFTSRMIKAIFTTETFALGINMPARSVIFGELRKFDAKGFGPLKTRDFNQMAGRAGRRSIDTEGFVFCRINPAMISSQQLHRIVFGQPERITSRFNASYATLLNLYAKHGERIYEFYPLSFHFHQEKKHRRKKALDLLISKIGLLKDMGYIEHEGLTDKGKFAARVYGYELILSEFHALGILEQLSDVGLALLAAAIVYEPRKDDDKPFLKGQARTLEKTAGQLMGIIQAKERVCGLEPSKPAYFHLSPAIEGWIRGESFDVILLKTKMDEGEIVRYFRMTIQILREVHETEVSNQLKSRIENLIRLINRDVIDAEKQLRG